MSNPLFRAYASVVERFFSQGRVGDRIDVFPVPEAKASSKGVDALSSENASIDASAPGHISELVNQNELKVTQGVVDHFRGALRQARDQPPLRQRGPGAQDASPGSAAQLPGNLVESFSQFQSALEKEDETGLQANPFYELTKLVFRHNLTGARNLFDAIHLELVANPPEKVHLLRRFREIWLGGSRLSPTENAGILRKLSDQIDSWMGLGKVVVAVILYFGSSFTTGRGVNDLLQSPDVSQLAGGMFDGREAEALRYLISLTIALLLSSAILDYKDRLFRSIAEEGGVLRGIRNAILRDPCWMVLATFLTFVSIKTNYDGIVSIISKKADLAKQSEQIRTRVKRAMGSVFFVNTLEPNDLHDLQGLLHRSTDASIAKFKQIPEDEVSGVASSGDPRKGPRYWGKYFIVHGSYAPGINDVAHAYRKAALSHTIDTMLVGAGIDLSTSLVDKIHALRKRYDDHISKTKTLVDQRLDKLNGLMEMRSYSLEEIKRVFALEHYQINDIVLSMATALEENTVEYGKVARALNELTDSYVAVLQKVDKAGAAARREYHIEGRLEIPNIDAIKELKDTKIPRATHKSFAELKEFLISEYGLALANGLLFIILFVSFCMDLLDPLIYCRWTALIGRQDKRMFPDLMEYLREWENDFVVGCHQFFYRRDVQQVFRGLPFPNRTGIRNAFYLQLEDINPLLRDPKDHAFFQRNFDWFKGLFRLTRTGDMRAYNQRAGTIHAFVEGKDRYFPRLINYLFPGLKLEAGLESGTFASLLRQAETGQAQHREVFALELQISLGNATSLPTAIISAGNSWDEQKALSSTLTALESKRKSLGKHRDAQALSGRAEQKIEQSDLPLGYEQTEKVGAQDVLGPLTPSGAVVIPKEMLKACLRPEKGIGPFSRLFFKENSPAHQRWQRLRRCALLPSLEPFAHTRRRWLWEIAKRDGRPLDDVDGLYDFMPDLKNTLLVTLPKIQEEYLESLEEIRGRFPDRCSRIDVVSSDELKKKLKEIEKESLQILGLSPVMVVDQTRLYAPVGGGIDIELEGVSRDVLNHVGGDTVGFNERIAALLQLTEDTLERAKEIETSAVQDQTRLYAPVGGGIDIELEGVSRDVLNYVGGDTVGFNEKIAALLRLTEDTLERAKEIEASAVQDITETAREIKKFCENAKQILLKINMSGSESRKARLPPRNLLRLLRQNKDILEQAPRQSEVILGTMEQIFSTKEPHTEASLEVLEKLRDEAAQVFEDVRGILVAIQGEGEGADSKEAVDEVPPREEHVAQSDVPQDAPEPVEEDSSKQGDDSSPDLDPGLEVTQAAYPSTEQEAQETPQAFDRPQEIDEQADEAGDGPALPFARANGKDGEIEVHTETAQQPEDVVTPVSLPGQEDGLQTAAVDFMQEEAYVRSEQAEAAPDASSPPSEEGREQLITVAVFSKISHEESSPAVVPPAPRRADRIRQFSEIQWGQHAEGLDDDHFFSGVVSADSMTGPPVAESFIVEPAATELPVSEPSVSKEAVKPNRKKAVSSPEPLRKQAETSLDFSTKDGVRFRGVAKDVSLNGLKLGSDLDLSHLREQKQGRLQLVSDTGIHQFPCEVMEVSETDITLKLFSGDYQFEEQNKGRIFKDLRQDHQALKQDHWTMSRRDAPRASSSAGGLEGETKKR